MTKEQVIKNLQMLANQEKDLSVKYKVNARLAREFGVDLEENEQLNQQPIINIGVVEPPKKIHEEEKPKLSTPEKSPGHIPRRAAKS